MKLRTLAVLLLSVAATAQTGGPDPDVTAIHTAADKLAAKLSAALSQASTLQGQLNTALAQTARDTATIADLKEKAKPDPIVPLMARWLDTTTGETQPYAMVRAFLESSAVPRSAYLATGTQVCISTAAVSVSTAQ